MSKRALAAAPAELVELLDGRELTRRVGETFELITISDEGWPNVALLSVGEVLAVSGTEIRLALWCGTRTAGSLERSGRATLACVLPPAAYTVRLGGVDRLPSPADALAFYACRVEAVEVDTVGYAELIGGIRFRLGDPAAVVERWQRTIDALRAAG